MKESNVKRDHYIDNLKAILIFLVVIGHFSMCFKGSVVISNIKFLIYVFHMPCFVFVSGYLAKSSYRKGQLRSDKILSFIWLYLLFKIAMSCCDLLIGNGFDLSLFKDNEAPWYLLCMAIWYLMIPFMMSIKPVIMLGGAVLVGILIGYLRIFSTTFSMSRVFVFLPFFVIGLYLEEEQLKRFLANKRLRITALVIMTAAVVLFLTSIDLVKPYLKIIYGGVGYAKISTLSYFAIGGVWRAIWYAAAGILSASLMFLVPVKQTWFGKYGSRTLQIFILHILIRNILSGFGFFTWCGQLPELVNVLICWGGSILFTVALGNASLEKIFNVLSGGQIFKKVLR